MYNAILYFRSLPGVTILLQVHHHTVLYVSVRVHKPSTSTSPCCTLRLCPGSQSFYKYITILYLMYLPGVTIHLQVHYHVVLYVSAQGQNPSTITSPYCTLRLSPGSQSFYMFITIMYFTSLPGVTILIQVYHHTVLNVSALVHNPLKSTSPYSTLRLCPGSQSFYKYITILYLTSLPGVTILLLVHHHSIFYVSARGHNPSTTTSPYCTLRLCPGSQSFYNYITILHFTIRLCPGSQSFYKYITILYFTSLPGVTILLQVHHHTVLYVSAWGHNPSTSTSPYSTIHLSRGSQSLYKYITILYFTTLPGVIITLQVHHHTILNVSVHITILYVMSLPGVTILLQVHHHTVLDVSARGHNPSTSTSPCCTLGLCQGSQSF